MGIMMVQSYSLKQLKIKILFSKKKKGKFNWNTCITVDIRSIFWHKKIGIGLC